jgi:hypothetical protein
VAAFVRAQRAKTGRARRFRTLKRRGQESYSGGVRYLETLLEQQGRRVEVVHLAETRREDLVADLVSIVSSFCARLYGPGHAKRKTETIVRELTSPQALVVDEREEEREQEVAGDAPR